jgi:hypothetical protein
VNNLKDLLPKDKFDTECIFRIQKEQVLAPYLASLDKQIVPHIKMVMTSDDNIWKYWCLLEVVKKLSSESILLLKDVLINLRDNPSIDEKDENLNQLADEILKTVF